MNSVEALNLIKIFKTKRALDGITFSIPKDCIVGLIGRNGAGKTTLLKSIAGHLRPSEGKLEVFGEKPFDNLKVLSNMIYMDDDRYNDTDVLRDLIDMASFFYSNFDKNKALKLMDYFGIPVKYKFKKLSKGTKTIFSLIIAILSRCPLTMLDEPTLGLDASHRKEFSSLLLKDYSDYPRTFIISSHLIAELEGLMEQVLLIDKGQLFFHKSIEDVQSYALYLSGNKKTLEPVGSKHKLIFSESMGEKLTLGIVNDFKEKELDDLKKLGIEINPMSVQDVCVNVTSNRSGGVLDVFSK